MLHKRWRFLFIDTLKKNIKKHLKKNPDCGELSVFAYDTTLDAFLDPLLSINWYVHDSKELAYENFSVSYIGRYTKKPPLAENRIIKYFKNKGKYWVTFSYKERNKPIVYWTLTASKFIKLLIQHILPHNFRIVRYGIS